MYRRYFILTILLLSMMAGPRISVMATSVHTDINEPSSLIETRLGMEIASNQGIGTPAVLEFSSQLTPLQIATIEKAGVEFVKRGSTIVNVGRIYSAIVHDVQALYAIIDQGFVRATSGSKQYIPSLSSSVPAIYADDVWNNLEKDGERIDGSGVTVAVIDTGADWLHPTFWRAYDAEFNFLSSGPNYYVDLNGNGAIDPGEGPIRNVGSGLSGSFFQYSSDYMYISTDGNGGFDYADGDRWIGGIDADDDGYIDLITDKVVILNVSKIAILYDQFASNVYIRGVNLTQAVSVEDSNYDGHGTHVSSTVAGGQIGMTSYVGVAPGADLIIIRSPLSSADILDGISFAVENEANVINMSFSSYLGFLDGTDPEDLAISEAFLNYGVLTTTAAGNLGNKNKHARFSVSSGSSTSAILDVDHEPQYSYLSILWRSSDRDEHVILSPPTGDPIDLGEYSTIAGNAFALDEPTLSAYVFCEISPRGMNNIIIQVSTTEHDWMDGTWNVIVENPSGESVWVDSYAWDGFWETDFLQFLSQTDNYYTVSSPGTSDFAIAVSSYSETTLSVTSSSSRGPRIDGVAKPDIAAPGYSITAARNSLSSLWLTKSGTSMASPHVAGAIALILQAEGNGNAWRTYSALVNGAGGFTSHNDIAVSDFGHGLCNAAVSVMHVFNETMEYDSPKSDWSIVPTLVSDSLDPAVSPELDIRSVKVFEQVTDIAFSVTTTSPSDFSGTNMLSIEWDTDSNPSTGINGADLLLNLTANTLDIYEWTGLAYDSSTLLGSWWADSTSIFVKIEGFSDITRGSIVVSTHNATTVNADTTPSTSISDVWRPLIDSLVITSQDDSLLIKVQSEDRDSSITDGSVGYSVVDGDLILLNSSIIPRIEENAYIIDINIVVAQYVNSLSFNITSETNSIFSPLVILSGSITNFVQFTDATLDKTVIRTGLLFDEKITGEITLDGYELVSEILIAFQSESGSWRNFTLSGEGVYTFTIASSGFTPGDYKVYAIANSDGNTLAQMQFATLTVIEDNTLIMVITIALLVGLVIIFAIRRLKK